MREEIERQTLLAVCGRQMWCPHCGNSLDAPRAVSADLSINGKLVSVRVSCVDCWPELERRIGCVQANLANGDLFNRGKTLQTLTYTTIHGSELF